MTLIGLILFTLVFAVALAGFADALGPISRRLASLTPSTRMTRESLKANFIA